MKKFRKRMLSNGLAMALVLSSLATIPVSATNNKNFKDIKGHWAENQIKNFLQKGYIQGYGDGTFRPDKNITRAEFITIINMAFGFTEKGSEEFNDVSPGDWFYDEVLKASKKGYIDGYGDGTFRPNDSISREEACKIVGVILKVDGYGNTKFKDDNEINEWSKKYIKGLVDIGIIKGFEDNTFRPQNKATRAESVTAINNASEYKPSTGGGETLVPSSRPTIKLESITINESGHYLVKITQSSNSITKDDFKVYVNGNLVEFTLEKIDNTKYKIILTESIEVGDSVIIKGKNDLYGELEGPNNSGTGNLEVEVSSQTELIDAINSDKKDIVITNNIELTQDITIDVGQTLEVQSELIVNGTINLNGGIKVGSNRRSSGRIMLDSSSRMNINNGSYLEFNSFEDIITESLDNLQLYANSRIKIGDKVYIGQKNDSNALINLDNYEGSNKPVGGFFINGDGDLLLIVFEKAKVMKIEPGILDLSILVKAGGNNTESGELTIPNLDVLGEININNSVNTGGSIAIEANGTLICEDKVLVSKDDQNSVFNASGGDIDNNKGITFKKNISENADNIAISTFSAYICGDTTMNKGLSGVNIIPEYKSGQTYENSINIAFEPNNDVLLSGIDIVEKAKYESNNGMWMKKDIEEAFTDIKGHWAESIIKDFADKGYLEGYKGELFYPNDTATVQDAIDLVENIYGENLPEGYLENINTSKEQKITREEIATIIGRILNLTSNGDKTFADDSNISEWASKYVYGLLDAGIIGAYGDNTFRPKGDITRAEAIAILSKAINYDVSLNI